MQAEPPDSRYLSIWERYHQPDRQASAKLQPNTALHGQPVSNTDHGELTAD